MKSFVDYGNEFVFHQNDNWESFSLLVRVDILMVCNLVLLVGHFY